jgi:hypothetical protein
MIPQKLGILRSLESSESQVWLQLHTTQDDHLPYKETDGPIMIVGGIK